MTKCRETGDHVVDLGPGVPVDEEGNPGCCGGALMLVLLVFAAIVVEVAQVLR